jgi:hypothetical protein
MIQNLQKWQQPNEQKQLKNIYSKSFSKILFKPNSVYQGNLVLLFVRIVFFWFAAIIVNFYNKQFKNPYQFSLI